MENTDLEVMYAWENDSSLWELGDTTTPFSRSAIGGLIDQANIDIYAAKQLRLIIELTAGRVIGCVDLYDFNPLQRRVAIGILIYEPEDRTRGYASMAITLMLEYVRKRLNMHQVWVDVPLNNEPSLRLFRGVGFCECGLRRDWILGADGEFRDVIMLQKIL